MAKTSAWKKIDCRPDQKASVLSFSMLSTPWTISARIFHDSRRFLIVFTGRRKILLASGWQTRPYRGSSLFENMDNWKLIWFNPGHLKCVTYAQYRPYNLTKYGNMRQTITAASVFSTYKLCYRRVHHFFVNYLRSYLMDAFDNSHIWDLWCCIGVLSFFIYIKFRWESTLYRTPF